jgi:hypothetical protein
LPLKKLITYFKSDASQKAVPISSSDINEFVSWYKRKIKTCTDDEIKKNKCDTKYRKDIKTKIAQPIVSAINREFYNKKK